MTDHAPVAAPSTARRRVLLPVGQLAATPTRPDVCSRHGLPAVRHVDFLLQSRPQLSGNRFLSGNVLGVAARLAEHGAKVQVATVTQWPLCRRCARTRRTWLSLAAILSASGCAALAAAVVARLVIGEPTAALALPFIGGLVMLLSTPAPFVLASLPRIVRARTSRDGASVELTDPHPEFVRQVQTLPGP